jgi:hypothetical protein
MLFWYLWLDWLSVVTQPVTVQVTVRVPRVPNVIDFAAEKAKRVARHG